MLGRRANIRIIYQGVDITTDIKQDLVEFSYTDNASGEADDISITLKDEQKRWITQWKPQKGDEIEASIQTINWNKNGDNYELDCGLFIVDQPEFSGRPMRLTLQALSMPANNDFTRTEKSRTWEEVTISEIAKNVAENAGLNLFFDSGLDPMLSFLEQSEVSDMAFLYDVCKNHGLAMKVYSKKIIIFSEEEYENKPAVAVITESDMTDWTARTTLTDTGYDGCLMEYFDPLTEELLEYSYILSGRSGVKVFKINELAASVEEAERRVKSKLRELNRKETLITINLPGSTKLVASNNIEITDLGVFSGKYYIDQVKHVCNGYTCQLELHKILEGY